MNLSNKTNWYGFKIDKIRTISENLSQHNLNTRYKWCAELLDKHKSINIDPTWILNK